MPRRAGSVESVAAAELHRPAAADGRPDGRTQLNRLPERLVGLKETLPGWAARLRHPAGPGRYRFTIAAYGPYDLDSSCMMLHVLKTTNCAGPLPESDRRAWAECLAGLQRPEDGLMIDPGMEKHIITRGDRASESEALAPAKEQSNVTGTSLNVQTAALLANLAGLREDLGWPPTTETVMGRS